ncbi:15566_t:CDS:1, partial [Cetraspora pellucida]
HSERIPVQNADNACSSSLALKSSQRYQVNACTCGSDEKIQGFVT